jgi:flagellar biosynthesis protein FlhF
MSENFEKLVKEGCSEKTAGLILNRCLEELGREKIKKETLVEGWIARFLMNEIQIAPPKTDRPVHMFVGPPGHGKTSSVVKFASYLVIEKGLRVAIISSDWKRIGNGDQLKTCAQILNVPFAVVRKKKDWLRIFSQLEDIDLFVVDTAGTSLKDLKETEIFRSLMPDPDIRHIHYVISGSTRFEEAIAGVGRFMAYGLDDLVLTKIDECSSFGFIFDFSDQTGIPLHSFGIGPSVPDDLEMATRERVLDLIFRLTEINELGEE